MHKQHSKCETETNKKFEYDFSILDCYPLFLRMVQFSIRTCKTKL